MKYRQAERVYFAGVTLTALAWASMIVSLFESLGPIEQLMLITFMLGLVAASNATMGYRRSSYQTYTVIIMLAAVYVVYSSDLPAKNIMALAAAAYTLFILGASISFYRNIKR